MPYTVIDKLPERKKKTRVQTELQRFWQDDKAQYAIVDHALYKDAKTCASSYFGSAKKMKIPADVSLVDNNVYLIKQIRDE